MWIPLPTCIVAGVVFVFFLVTIAVIDDANRQLKSTLTALEITKDLYRASEERKDKEVKKLRARVKELEGQNDNKRSQN